MQVEWDEGRCSCLTNGGGPRCTEKATWVIKNVGNSYYPFVAGFLGLACMEHKLEAEQHEWQNGIKLNFVHINDFLAKGWMYYYEKANIYNEKEEKKKNDEHFVVQ